MGYTNIDNNIMNYNISGGAFKLYFLLQSMCYDKKVQCFPSQDYLAKKLNKSVRTIQRYLEELIKENLIEKKRRGSISNIYTMVLKMVSQKSKTMVDSVKEIKKRCEKKNQDNIHELNRNTKESYSYKNKKYTSNSYNKKESNWDLEGRNYDFKNLENMLLGHDEYDVNKLYK